VVNVVKPSSLPIAAMQQPVTKPRNLLILSSVEIEDDQLGPVVWAIQMPRVNLLIAADVGLGKTIEAGMVGLERYGSPSRRDKLTIGKTHRSPTLLHPVVRHVFHATVHCLKAGMWHRLSYHEGHEEHEGNQSTNRFMPSFSLITLKFISSPTLISANFIEVNNGAS